MLVRDFAKVKNPIVARRAAALASQRVAPRGALLLLLRGLLLLRALLPRLAPACVASIVLAPELAVRGAQSGVRALELPVLLRQLTTLARRRRQRRLELLRLLRVHRIALRDPLLDGRLGGLDARAHAPQRCVGPRFEIGQLLLQRSAPRLLLLQPLKRRVAVALRRD